VATVEKASVLTQEELQRFSDDGFLLKRALAPSALVEQISRECDALHEDMARHTPEKVGVSWEALKDGRPKRIRQLMHSEIVSPGLNQFVRSDAVLDIIETLIGPDIALFHSKLLMKAANDGTITPWHQDFAYWKKGENKAVQVNCMLAIDPATNENGCIQFVPGSHKQGLLSHDRRNEAFGVFLPGYFNHRDDAVKVDMFPGDCVFFGSLVIHGSDGNTSAKNRRANTAAYTVTGNDFPGYCREVLRGKPMPPA
jgi:ectoine hydroxylase-related dioxygenase (phytanoyl-CoA dioxygenase family)